MGLLIVGVIIEELVGLEMLIPAIQLKAFIIEAFVVVLPLPGASILRS